MTDAPISPILVATFRAYVHQRAEYYANTSKVLKSLLAKDVLLFAMRGVRSVEDFVTQAFAAHESSSEESVWGNAWQEAITSVSPNTVGGGDLKVERDGTLWVVQLKLGAAQNSGAKANDLRLLRQKMMAERDHQPGRRNIRPMYAIIRGAPKNEGVIHKERSSINQEINGFQYQLVVGRPFLNWTNAAFESAVLVRALDLESQALQTDRSSCIEAVLRLLDARLVAAGRGRDIFSVLQLAEPRGVASDQT